MLPFKDVGNIGNSEFDYGLDFLEKTLKGSDFPCVSANVYIDDKDNDLTNDKNYFDPYLIIDKKVRDQDGEEHMIKVGVIGFVPPQIMNWDKAHLEGKVIGKDIVESAEKFVPWAYEYIQSLTSKGIILGKTDGCKSRSGESDLQARSI